MGLFDNPQIVAVIIQEGSRIASEMLRARGPSKLKSEPVDLEQFVMDTPNRFPSLQTKPTISIVAEQPAEQQLEQRVDRTLRRRPVPDAQAHRGLGGGDPIGRVRTARR